MTDDFEAALRAEGFHDLMQGQWIIDQLRRIYDRGREQGRKEALSPEQAGGEPEAKD